MQQTLLALLALMIATMLSLSQMQSDLQDQNQVVQAEMKEMAIGVATQTLEVIRARAFDDKTIGVSKSDITNPVADLTKPPFSQGNDCAAFGGSDTCDDVDDFHKMETAVVPFEASEFEVKFNVDARVRYVDANQDSSGTPTFRKEVILTIQDKGKDPHIRKPITFSEVITFH